MKGKVIMFNNSKGYGFIKTLEGNDIFFHCSQLLIPGEDFKTVKVNQEVDFEIEESERGYRAINIKILN